MTNPATTVRWQSARTGATTALLILAGGDARVVVTSGGATPDTVGSYACPIDDLPVTLADGPADFVVDSDNTGSDARRAAAESVAAAVREHPLATARFALVPGDRAGSGRAFTLAVGNAAHEPVEFTLDAARCTIDFVADGQAVGWQPFPDLPTGFVTADAEGIGGVRMRATLGPGVLGAIVFDVAVPASATEACAHVLGLLHVPGEPEPLPFAARTAMAPLR